MDSSIAEKIWFAGLGAIARAEQEGEAWLTHLMKEGEDFANQQSDSLIELAESLKESTATNKEKAKQKFTNIEQSFEEKVAQSLHRAGLATHQDFKQMRERLDELEQKLNQR